MNRKCPRRVKLSASIGRHLKVHVVSSSKYAALTARDYLGVKLAGAFAIEIIAKGIRRQSRQLSARACCRVLRRNWRP